MRFECALEAVKEAGKLVAKGFLEVEKSTEQKSNVNDVVTVYDKKAQDVIVSIIQQQFPDDVIIGEENGLATIQADTAWIIDPIDGTNPYTRGIDTYGIVVGYMQDFQTQFCVVYNPTRDELLTAKKGEGAFLNGEAISIAQRPFASQWIILEGFDKKDLLPLQTAFGKDTFAATKLHSSAFTALQIASGKVDGLVAEIGPFWDKVHYLILEEAGATITNFEGEAFDLRQSQYIAAHPELHEQYLKIVQKTLQVEKEGHA